MKNFITKEGFGVVALTVLLIPQIAHTVYVFQTNSQYSNPWFSYCYAIGVEGAILIFTVKGWKRTALGYLAGTLAHNLVYQFWPDSQISGVLICIMLSATIYSFSHLFYSEKKDTAERSVLSPQQQKMAAHLVALEQRGIALVPQPYTCPECQKAFGSSKELNGHISGHKQKGDWKADQYGEWERKMQENVAYLSKEKSPLKVA